jgi:hypothetical protein
MKRRHTRLLAAGLVALALLCAGGYLLLSGGRDYSSDLNGLRTRFNQDRPRGRLPVVEPAAANSGSRLFQLQFCRRTEGVKPVVTESSKRPPPA